MSLAQLKVPDSDTSPKISVLGTYLCIYHGIYTKLIEQNGLGGIRGRRLKLAIVDDEYTPAIAKKNVYRLVSEQR